MMFSMMTADSYNCGERIDASKFGADPSLPTEEVSCEGFSLQDIEIASRLVGFDVDNEESLDEKYKKVRCDIALLPHDSNNYRLIEIVT
ncbi:Poly [ADP-ribose] polymerase 1 [Camellia lanceoleosa]|uniref:Poly [ADP-ribose] polymerase 1 n=1 Tax=Camellia lanceoleosa TaxID=1840588 RepID=A0ACC0HKQ7_9ERIC|nr:Poly [ADP-ribose] polymerase 1 [Camellia lanceoleosa]